jgi:membrane-associated phospholipid phosphatase
VSIFTPEGERSVWQELGQAGRRAVPIFVGIGVVVVLLGLLITKVLEDTGFADADAGVNRWFAKHRGSTLNTLTHLGTLFGETVTIVALTAITVVAFRVVFHRWRESVILTICVVGQSLIFLITTILIDRDRPPVPHLDDSPPTSSFPSGHTAASVALWCGLALGLARTHPGHPLRVLSWVLAVALPGFVLVSRLYRGMHWPTDVAASVVFTLLWLLLLRAVLLPPDRADPPRAPLRR